MGRMVERDCTTTRAGQKLLDVLLDPASSRMTAVQRAQAANISLRRYHQLLADIDFQAQFRARVIEGLAPDVPAIVDASRNTALGEGRDGFKDREMLLRMSGAYQPSEGREITGAGGGAVAIEFVRPPQE